jgi:hypothetical protein
MSKITIVVVEPDKVPYAKVIDNQELEPMKEIVGGYIQLVRALDWNLVCNEEGDRLKLPPNRFISELGNTVTGNFFLAGAINRDGDFDTLSQDEIETIIAVFSAERIYS